jgi:hypothetical protein
MKFVYALSAMTSLVALAGVVNAFVIQPKHIQSQQHQRLVVATSSAASGRTTSYSTNPLYSTASNQERSQQLCPLLAPPEDPTTTFEAAMG